MVRKIYYQPEIVFDTIKDIIVDIPDDLRYNEVFPTKEDAKEWCRRHEYTDYYIREYKEGEIEGIRVINSKGEIIAVLTEK